MYKHITKEHAEEKDEVEFEMKVVGKFKHAMTRQIDEAIRIKNKNPETILNSKSEYHGPVVKRKVVEGRERRQRRPGKS